MSTAVHPSPTVHGRQPLLVGAIVGCPGLPCDQPAEVVDLWIWPSTAGPIAHARTRCAARHVFTVPTDSITASDA